MNQKNGMPSIVLLVLLVSTVWYGCSRGGAIPTPPATHLETIMLPENQEDLVSLAKQKLFPLLWTLAQNPENTLRVGFKTATGAIEFLQLSFEKGNKVLKIVKESTGELRRLTWGGTGVELASEQGETKVGFKQIVGDIQLSGTEDLLKVGATVTGIALAVWLGAGLASTILSFIGFIAFLAMVVGIIVVSAALLYVFNVNKEKVVAFLEQSKEEMSLFFQRVTQEIGKRVETAP